MILLLFGDDTYRSRERVKFLEEGFRKKYDHTGVNSVHLDGERLTPEQFSEHVSAQGFLSTKRFIIISNLVSGGTAAAHEAVITYLTERGATSENILVFLEESEPPSKVGTRKKKGIQEASDQRKKLWAKLSSLAKQEHFPQLAPKAVGDWILAEAQRRGGQFEKKAAFHLAAFVGPDLWRASTEIEKLIHYRLGQIVTVADIDQLVTASIDENVFRLTDALGAGDLALGLKIFEELFQHGTEPLYLLRMLNWHLRTLISVRSSMDQGTENPRVISRELKLHPFVAQKAIRQVSQFTLERLVQAYQGLLELEITIKTRSVNPRVLFDLLVVRLIRSSPEPSSAWRLPGA